MKKPIGTIAVTVAALFFLNSSRAAETPSPLTLYYTNAAEKWVEALPIGNGRLEVYP